MLRTLKALNGSIAKWEGILFDGNEDRGASDCPLCKLFARFSCEGCPIKEKTGMRNCYNTPYDDWTLHHENVDRWVVCCGEAREIAREELAFLKQLAEEYEDRIARFVLDQLYWFSNNLDSRIFDIVDELFRELFLVRNIDEVIPQLRLLVKVVEVVDGKCAAKFKKFVQTLTQ